MTPDQRAEKLGKIAFDEAQNHHEWLRQCFVEELRQRLAVPDYDWYENIYHCALLLHIISDLEDLPLMYSAKCSGDMDLGCGFDWQFLFMRDPETLIQYARSIDRQDIASWVYEYTEAYEDEDMSTWLEGTKHYHRPD